MSMVLQAAIWMAVHRPEDVSLLNLFLERLHFELPLVTSQRIRKKKKLLLITLFITDVSGWYVSPKNRGLSHCGEFLGTGRQSKVDSHTFTKYYPLAL